MMSGVVVVTKASPVVVRPSGSELGTPPPRETVVALSSFDRRTPAIWITSLLVFDHAIPEPAETIKGAQSRALAHYRPIAGRLDGAGSIACTDEGVTFVAASASCSLEEAEATEALHQTDLAVRYPAPLCRDAEPLLLMQVTVFTCGGFVVGVTSNHVLADGVGMAQFLQAVAELAREDGVSPPSVVPVRRWDDGSLSLPAASSAVAARVPIPEHDEPHHDLVRLDVHIPWSLVCRIKGKAETGSEACTVLDAVMAVLWRCRTRAVGGDAQSPAHLTFLCNMRAHAGAPAGYYGNCVHVQLVPATAGAVASSSIGHLVRLIRRAKEKAFDRLLPAADEAPAPPLSLWYEAFNVTDWRSLGLHEIDSGGGVPARVLWQKKRIPAPGCVVCPPRRAGRKEDGVEVSSMFLKPEHVDAFLGELAALAAAPSAD